MATRARPPEFAASLSIVGDDLEPDEVSRLLGCEPDDSHRVGDRVSSRSTTLRKNGAWSIQDDCLPTESLSTKIEAVLDRISVDPLAWQAARGRFDAILFCGIFLNQPDKLGEMVTLPEALLRRVSDLGLRLELDVWPPAGEEPRTEREG